MHKTLVAFSLTVLLAAIVGLVPAFAAEGEGADAAALYAKKCAMCHGKDGVAKPMGKGSANLNDSEWQNANSAEAIVKVTAEGKNKMPKYAEKLTADEIKAIADHILTLE